MTRMFESHDAVRASVPLMIGLVGASGAGKTYSALRLATGMAKGSRGDVYVLDTESDRALFYADEFRFRHVPFKPPFSPDDYLAAIQYIKQKKPAVLIIDSLSHEHEGQGGVLEMHDEELDRRAGTDPKRRERLTFAAWIKPKQARARLLNEMTSAKIHIISCFRSKRKTRPRRGQEPLELGWMPIAGDEFVYEQALQCMLYPSSGGVPTWDVTAPGEKMVTKLPAQFAPFFPRGTPITEETGEKLAAWAAGDASEAPAVQPSDEDLASVLDLVAAAESGRELEEISRTHRDRLRWSDAQRAKIRTAFSERARVLSPDS